MLIETVKPNRFVLQSVLTGVGWETVGGLRNDPRRISWTKHALATKSPYLMRYVALPFCALIPLSPTLQALPVENFAAKGKGA